nr:hypothetical protein [Tanacetum cinerariifolium]
MKLKSKALKERTKVSRPLKAFKVYPPNTPAALVPKVLPTKSQVKIHIFTLIQLFLEFDQTCEKRITPTAITDGERGFEQTKACYLKKVIPFFKTLKENFEAIQKALTKEVKEMKDVFEELKAELKYKNLKDGIGNNPPTPDKHTPDFDSVFVIGKMQASLQRKDNVIRQLKKQLSQLQVTRSDTDRTLRVQTTDSRITKLTDHVTHLQAQNDLFRAENNKIKQHYKELNNRDAHLDYLRHLKESVETIHNIIEEAKVVRPRDRSIVSACRYTKHSQELLEYAIGTYPQGSQQRAKQLAHIPLIKKKQVTITKSSDKSEQLPNASGSQPKSHVKANRISPAKGDNKLPVDDQPRKNKSHLRTSNRIDSSSRLKRTLINLHSNSICQTCNKCLTPFNHDLCVAACLQSAMATPSIRYNSSVERKVKQVWKPKQVKQV